MVQRAPNVDRIGTSRSLDFPQMTIRTLDRAALVGTGLTSDVYAWGEGRVLKLCHRHRPADRVEAEFQITRAVHGAGLPVPAAYELVEIEGRRGIVFERVDGPSMFEYVQSRPWTLFAAARQLAELHAQVHGCAAPLDLPRQSQWIENRIETSECLSEADKQLVRRSLAELPDGEVLCHGDFHPGNILLTRRGPVIIDWSTGSRGHPLGDVACTSYLFDNANLPAAARLHIRLLFKVSRDLLHRKYLNRYLQLRSGSRRQIDAWLAPIQAAKSGWREGNDYR
jgi:uncharacterized protein (TIGR02172 family)